MLNEHENWFYPEYSWTDHRRLPLAGTEITRECSLALGVIGPSYPTDFVLLQHLTDLGKVRTELVKTGWPFVELVNQKMGTVFGEIVKAIHRYEDRIIWMEDMIRLASNPKKGTTVYYRGRYPEKGTLTGRSRPCEGPCKKVSLEVAWIRSTEKKTNFTCVSSLSTRLTSVPL